MLSELIKRFNDVYTISESKPEDIFSNNQFLLGGYCTPSAFEMEIAMETCLLPCDHTSKSNPL